MASDDRTIRYLAFISYSHAGDRQVAAAVQDGLLRLGHAWYQRPRFRIFRDDTSLTATPQLWGMIETALDRSDHLIVLASRAAASSQWVAKEVCWWLDNRSPDTLLIGLTEGDIAWDPSRGDFDPEGTTALPEPLMGAFRSEPRWIDLRGLRGELGAITRHSILHDRVADFAATLHGVSKEDLVGADIARQRQWVRLRNSAIGLLMVLVVAASALAVLFLGQRNEARNQAAIAEAGQRLATARLLLTRAEAAVGTDPRTALMLLAAASRISPTAEIEASLVNTLLRTRYTGTLSGHLGAVVALAITTDGRTMATASEDRTVILWDLGDPTGPRRIGTALTGHDGKVYGVAFSPDGRTLVTTGADTRVILWDVADPARPHRIGEPLTGHTRTVTTVAFAPDGRTLATASGEPAEDDVDVVVNRVVILWDITDPARPRRIGGPLTGDTGTVSGLAFSPDGRTLITAGEDTLILWNLADPTRPRRLGAPLTGDTGGVHGIALSPDGRTLAAAGGNGTVLLWNLANPDRPRRVGDPLPGHAGAVYGVAFSPDGHTLATAGIDRAVLLWDLSDPARPRRIGDPLTGHTDTVYAVAFAPDGRTLLSASGDDTTIRWNLSDPLRPRPLGEPLRAGSPWVSSVAFSPDGRTLVTDGGRSGAVIRWDVIDPAHARLLGGPDGDPGGADGNLVSSTVSLAPDGRTLATIVDSVQNPADPSRVVLWDVTDPAQPRRLGVAFAGHAGSVSEVAFAPTGNVLATASWVDNEVFLWDVADPARPRRLGAPLTGGPRGIDGLAFAPDGRTLATTLGAEDLGAPQQSMVALWDVSDPARARRIGDPLTGGVGTAGAPAFAPDGRILATTVQAPTTDFEAIDDDDDISKVILWDVTDTARPRQLGDPLTGYADVVYALTFAPDGRTLATATWDDTIVLWDLTDPARPRRLGDPLTSQAGRPSALAFSPDGRTLAAAIDTSVASEEKPIVLWDLTALGTLRQHALDRACQLTGRGLDPAEWARYVPALPYQDSCA
jgi:WD40 repeat protein